MGTHCSLRGQFEILEIGNFTVLQIYARERHVFVKVFVDFILQWKNQLFDSVFYSCVFQVRPRHQLLFQEKPVRWFRHFHQLISHFHLTLNLPSLTEASALLQHLHFQTDLEIPSVNFVFSNPLKIVRSSKLFTKLTNSLILHCIKYSYLLRLTLALLWPSSTSLYRFRLFNVRWTAILEVSIPYLKWKSPTISRTERLLSFFCLIINFLILTVNQFLLGLSVMMQEKLKFKII